jgi:hypothetical protein
MEPKLNTLERFYIHDSAKGGLQKNDTLADIHNPIFDTVIKTNTHITPHPTTSHTNPLSTHTTYSINTRNNSNIKQN